MIAWIIRDLVKLNNEYVYIVVLKDNDQQDLIEYFEKHYSKNHKVRLLYISGHDDFWTLISRADENHNITVIRNDILFKCNDISNDAILVDESNQIVCLKINSENNNCKTLQYKIEDDISYDSIIDKLQRQMLSKDEYFNVNNQNSALEARSKFIESRSFNYLKINKFYPEIVKNSKDREKLLNEYFWYRSVPEKFKSVVPQIFGFDKNGISMEYYGYGTLTEKFLYDNLSITKWKLILFRLFCLVKDFSLVKYNVNKDIFKLFYNSKLLKRIDSIYAKCPSSIRELLSANSVTINGVVYGGYPRLKPKLEEKLNDISNTAEGAFCHGDLCFNNILYDTKSDILKLIDPRGNMEGIPTIVCDPRYDIAKLRHSFCGNYDGVVEGEFSVCALSENEYKLTLSKSETEAERELIFDNLVINFGYDLNVIKIIEGFLFLTMIPLHCDSEDKMKAFYLISLIKLNKVLE